MISAEKTSAASPLRHLALEITGKCNLTCSHCYAESGPRLSLRGQMTATDWLRLIDEAAGLGCRELSFIGGEPTLHPELSVLIERAAGLGFSEIEVYTNATRLRPELLSTFLRHGVRLATSFYSAEPGPHEAITGVRGSWRQTVDGIAAALAAGLTLRATIVELEPNRGGAAAAEVFLRELGLEEIRVDRLRAVGRGLSAGEDGGGNEGEESFSALCGQCWKGRLCVTSSGEAFPCELARRTRLGRIEQGLGAVLRAGRLAEFRDQVKRHFEELSCQPLPCGPIGKRPPIPKPGHPGDPVVDPGCGPIREPPCGPSPSKAPPSEPEPHGDPETPSGPEPEREHPEICGPVRRQRHRRHPGPREGRPA